MFFDEKTVSQQFGRLFSNANLVLMVNLGRPFVFSLFAFISDSFE
jgi:hypothetical protein